MTQRTLEKMERAMAALKVAEKSFCKDVTDCKTKEERDRFFSEYRKLVDMMADFRSIIGKVETEVYLKEQKTISEMLDRR